MRCWLHVLESLMASVVHWNKHLYYCSIYMTKERSILLPPCFWGLEYQCPSNKFKVITTLDTIYWRTYATNIVSIYTSCCEFHF
jgi:hypothetical protein